MDEQNINIEERKWKHRRRLAYMAFFSLLAVIGCVLFIIPETRLSILNEPITWSFFTLGGIVAAYMGFSTWDGINRK